MEFTLASYYRCWYQFEKDAHAKVLSALEAVPGPRRSTPEYRKALGLVAHIAAARELWLFRLGAIAEGPRELIPGELPIEEIREQLDAVETAWSRYLEDLDDAQLTQSIRYRSTEGPWFKSTRSDILTQLFGHSAYHRGQIALLLRSIGAAPAITDYIVWSRESIEPPGGAAGR
ncbi:MAG TPA: DinB family protein [Terriglobales bacterium]|nr:DinB family protein [Terriglobales bacterium]